MKRRILIMVLSLLPAWSTAAGLDDIRRSAEQGDAQMQLELGELYEYGFGLPKNQVPALAWYILSAEQGNAQAAQRRDLLKGRMTREQVEEAERSAATWRKRLPREASDAAQVPARDTAPQK